jgi:hypothetical protein
VPLIREAMAAIYFADRAPRLRVRQHLIRKVVGVNSEMLLMLQSVGERSMWRRIRGGYRCA